MQHSPALYVLNNGRRSMKILNDPSTRSVLWCLKCVRFVLGWESVPALGRLDSSSHPIPFVAYRALRNRTILFPQSRILDLPMSTVLNSDAVTLAKVRKSNWGSTATITSVNKKMTEICCSLFGKCNSLPLLFCTKLERITASWNIGKATEGQWNAWYGLSSHCIEYGTLRYWTQHQSFRDNSLSDNKHNKK